MDRITRVRIDNVRALRRVDLAISPLTVLIGENGAGKSTILEVLELLRKAADPRFYDLFHAIHRGMPGLLRRGATMMTLGVVIEDDAGAEPALDYSFSLLSQAGGAAIHHERLVVGDRVAIDRVGNEGEIIGERGAMEPLRVPSYQLAITTFGLRPPPVIGRLLAVLGRVEVHLGFDTLAAWAAHASQRSTPMRTAAMLLPADRLTLLASNLANAWSTLKNSGRERWEETMALVRLGLGDGIDSVDTVADAGGGQVWLALRRSDLAEPIPAASLSDGQLAWLAFVAMSRLNPGRSLLAIDEPELHLHPSLLGRVIGLLKSLEGGAPIVLSTHSDRVLELLDAPAEALRVCSLGEDGTAVVQTIDAAELPGWLADFGDLGQLRASGYLPRVLRPPEEG